MTKWIKTLHKCPDTNREVLFFKSGRHQSVYTGFYDDKHFYSTPSNIQVKDVEYWSELPSYPK